MAEQIKILSTLIQTEVHRTQATSETSNDTHIIVSLKVNVKGIIFLGLAFLVPRIIDIIEKW